MSFLYTENVLGSLVASATIWSFALIESEWGFSLGFSLDEEYFVKKAFKFPQTFYSKVFVKMFVPLIAEVTQVSST